MSRRQSITHRYPTPASDPRITGTLDLMESIANMLPELLLESKKQGYEEAIRKSLGYGLTQAGASLLMNTGPFDPNAPKVVRPAMDVWLQAAAAA